VRQRQADWPPAAADDRTDAGSAAAISANDTLARPAV